MLDKISEKKRIEENGNKVFFEEETGRDRILGRKKLAHPIFVVLDQ